MAKRRLTTKEVSLVHQLLQEGQLRLAPEFQRNAVWPRSAKAYLIDTILVDRPMPLFFFQRGRSAQSGKPEYQVVDGQQRLRAIFEFIDGRFALSESEDKRWKGKTFAQLSPAFRDKILDYDLDVEELSEYSEAEIKDIFVRMNKYVIKLSPQELRHAKESGAFYRFVEALGSDVFWKAERVFTDAQISRMKPIEFSAEIAILLIEGPQDKKSSVDLYYVEYQKSFPGAGEVKQLFESYKTWIQTALPQFKTTRFRKPVDLYGLVGAIHSVTREGKSLKKLSAEVAGAALTAFSRDIESARPSKRAQRYLASTSRQTDNIEPRATRIEILSDVLTGR
jgi:hypothetical protein